MARVKNTWDGLDRLASQTSAKGTVGYTYTPNGLRKTMSVTGQPLISYSYDASNRLARIDQAAGAANNRSAQSVGFTYDAAGQRTQTRLPNGQTLDYTYDALGRRQTKSLDGWSTAYVYDGYI